MYVSKRQKYLFTQVIYVHTMYIYFSGVVLVVLLLLMYFTRYKV